MSQGVRPSRNPAVPAWQSATYPPLPVGARWRRAVPPCMSGGPLRLCRVWARYNPCRLHRYPWRTGKRNQTSRFLRCRSCCIALRRSPCRCCRWLPRSALPVLRRGRCFPSRSRNPWCSRSGSGIQAKGHRKERRIRWEPPCNLHHLCKSPLGVLAHSSWVEEASLDTPGFLGGGWLRWHTARTLLVSPLPGCSPASRKGSC